MTPSVENIRQNIIDTLCAFQELRFRIKGDLSDNQLIDVWIDGRLCDVASAIASINSTDWFERRGFVFLIDDLTIIFKVR